MTCLREISTLPELRSVNYEQPETTFYLGTEADPGTGTLYVTQE